MDKVLEVITIDAWTAICAIDKIMYRWTRELYARDVIKLSELSCSCSISCMSRGPPLESLLSTDLVPVCVTVFS